MGEEFVDQYDYQRLMGSSTFLTHIHLEISFVVYYVSIYICLLLKKHIWMKQNGFYVTYEGRMNMV
jgi:hypothetical protein